MDIPATGMHQAALDLADPDTPVGARGVGEPPVGAGYGAVLAAIADAVGDDVFRRAPVTPDLILSSLEAEAADARRAYVAYLEAGATGTRDQGPEELLLKASRADARTRTAVRCSLTAFAASRLDLAFRVWRLRLADPWSLAASPWSPNR